jgi:hypothetical protein
MKFIERNIDDFKNTIKNIFDLITIEGKYKVIGSSGLKNVLYNSDYDLAENDEFKNIQNGQQYVKKKFEDIFNKADKNKNLFITDFKCGIDSDGEPLRWTKDDIDNGYKTLQNKKKKTFEEALLDTDNTIKIDIIALIDGVFNEFSENLYFKFGLGKDAITNYNPKDITKPKILESIKRDFFEKLEVNKPFKALKRKFAYYKLLDSKKYNEMLSTLTNYFNSEVGICAKAHADIDTILLVMEKSDKVKINDVINNLQNIKQQLSYAPNLESLSETINKICSSKSKKAIENKLKKLNEKIYKFINKETNKFYKINHISKKRI